MNRTLKFIATTLLMSLVAQVTASSLWAQEKLPLPPEVRDPRIRIAWNRYYDYPDVTQILRRLNNAYPRLSRLESIGVSVEGRDMWLLTVFNPTTGAPEEKPAMWVDANVHGNEVQGAEAGLYLAWYLLENYGRVPAITRLLDRASFDHTTLWPSDFLPSALRSSHA